MAVDMFLKIEGIDGESNDSKHKGEIDVLSFSWGVGGTTPSKGSPSGRLSAAKAAISDFSIAKYVDTASPALFQKCCEGGRISQVSFVARKAGESQLEYYKIKLSDVLVSSVSPGGSTGGDAMETVSFKFASAEIYSAQQKADGSLGGYTVSTCGGSFGDDVIGE